MGELLPLKIVALCLLTAVYIQHASCTEPESPAKPEPKPEDGATAAKTVNGTKISKLLLDVRAILQSSIQSLITGGIKDSCQLWNLFPQWVSQNWNETSRQVIKDTIISYGATTSCPEFILMSEFKFPTREERLPLKNIKVPIVWVMGPPGSDKKTMCSMYKEANKAFTHISSGDLLRAQLANPPSKLAHDVLEEAMRKGDLVPDTVVFGLIIKEMLSAYNSTQLFMIEGYPSTEYQARLFKKQIKEPDIIMVLDASNEILRKRAFAENEVKTNDTENAFNNRLNIYRSETEPILTHYKINRVLVDLPTADENYERFSENLNLAINSKHLEETLEDLL